jgi:acyl-CoA synthetase (AMP-forming)/AMP-acid ligase II
MRYQRRYPLTLADLPRLDLDRRADKVAVIDGSASLTYAELAAQVDAVAAWLRAHGCLRGDRVGLHTAIGLPEVVATLGIAAAGGVIVNVGPMASPAQIAHVVKDCGLKAAFVDAPRWRALFGHAVVEQLPHVVVAGAGADGPGVTPWADVVSTPPGAGGPRPVSTDLAGLMYTSGSTGSPKGVMHTHLSLLRAAEAIATYLDNGPEDRVVAPASLSYSYVLTQLLTMLLVGGTVVLTRVGMPAELLGLARRERLTGLALGAGSWIRLVELLQSSPTALPDLRYLTSSGSSIPATTLDAMSAAFPGVRIYLMYGTTETIRSTYLDPDAFAHKRGSIGRSIPGADVRVIGGAGVCGVGEIGELVHRGATVALGYWGVPDHAAFRPNPLFPGARPDERVFHSGDLVHMDSDGDLWFVGRRDFLIKSDPFRISPEEVEDTVSRFDGVREVVAFGAPDAARGMVVRVAVRGSDGLDSKSVERYCRRHLPRYMWPDRVHVWPEDLPRTPSGKIDRRTVARRCLEEDVRGGMAPPPVNRDG